MSKYTTIYATKDLVPLIAVYESREEVEAVLKRVLADWYDRKNNSTITSIDFDTGNIVHVATIHTEGELESFTIVRT